MSSSDVFQSNRNPVQFIKTACDSNILVTVSSVFNEKLIPSKKTCELGLNILTFESCKSSEVANQTKTTRFQSGRLH